MKKNRNSEKLNYCEGLETLHHLLSWNRFCAIKGNFSFDIFQYLKAENEKLQIVYANIRV
jgi:hypothetical protein